MTSNKLIYNTICDNLNLIKHTLTKKSIQLAAYNFTAPSEGFFIKLDYDDELYLAGGVNYYRNKIFYYDWQPYSDKLLTKLITKCKSLELDIKKARMNQKLKDIEDDFK